MSLWSTVALSDIATICAGGKLKLSGKHFVADGFPAYGAGGRSGQVPVAEYAQPAIVLSSVGTCGRCYLTEESWTSLANTQVILPSPNVDRRFLWYQLNDPRRWPLSGTAQSFIKASDVKSHLVHLPPIDEQRRIAAVLDAADALRAKRREALAKLDTLTQAIFIDMFGSGGWPTSRLGDEVETTSGGTPSRRKPHFFQGSIPWVKSGEVAQGVVNDTGEHISEEALTASSTKLMPPGTVLLAMYGATVGAVGELGIEAATNQAVCCITPSATMSREYLIGLLKSMKDELVAKSAGGAQPNISQTIIRDLRVPVPPVSRQAAYAMRVEAVAAATERSRSSLSALDGLFAAVQQRAFRGEL